MTVDESKKSKKSLPLSSKNKEAEDSQEEESEEASEGERESDRDYEPEGSHSSSESGADSDEDLSENETDPKNLLSAVRDSGKKEIKKDKPSSSKQSQRKRKAKDSSGNERKKTKAEPVEEITIEDKGEEDKSKNEENKNEKREKKGRAKKELPIFTNHNLDLDLFSTSSSNVVPKIVRIAGNANMTCKMISEIDGKPIPYDYAALTFQRKTAAGKMFEFMLPLSLAPKIREGIDFIMSHNKKFFSGMATTEKTPF